MLEALKRLISPEYLVVADPGPMGGLWVLYAVLGALFAAGLLAAMWILVHKVGTSSLRALAWFEVWVCLAGLATVSGRFLNWAGWSARIWAYSLVVLAGAGVVVYRLRGLALQAWLATQLDILTFAPRPGAALNRGFVGGKKGKAFWLGLAVHLIGAGLVVSARYGWPVWTAPLVLLAILSPQWPLLARHRLPRLMALTPLLAAYGVTLLWLAYGWLGITVIGWQGQAFPNPMISLFYVDGIVLAAVAYGILCQVSVALAELERPDQLWRWAAAGLLAVTLTWAGVVYFGKRTHGATATDPYAYAQMGVDLAERGTFLHRFPLFQQVMPLKIAWAPLQPLGYHIPRSALGDCPSVWATGASVLLAAGYKLLGEAGLYVTTPIVALLLLAATWALVQEALRGQSRAIRHLTAALTIVLLATSPEHVDRLLVPMADAPTQLFTTLTLFFALRAMHQMEENRRRWGSVIAAGICLAWAYWTRHTQLVLALPVILALILGAKKKGSWKYVVLCGLAALVAATPDIVYRWRVFGGPLSTETTELPLMGLQHIGPVAWQMLREALVAGEWGYLFPLALYGGYRLARDRHRETLVLGLAFIAVLVVHLTYRSLRLRDLLSLFPLLDLAVAYGAVSLVRQARVPAGRAVARLGPALLSTAIIAGVILSLASARWTMIDNLWKPGWASFGYMRAEQRAAFERLEALTPANGVIGASLNSGAVMLYTGRDAIRPYDGWSSEEWNLFLDTMQAGSRPVYLLDDGELMAEFIAREAGLRRLTPLEALQVPLFTTEDRQTGWLYRLEWDQ
jgi:Dolichyl-phosphate-mannose-protein mannosyltransferase